MEEVKEEVRGSPKPGLSVTQKKEFSKKTRAEIVEELPTLPANTAQDVINLRRKDFAQNPADLIALLNAAEKSPALKAAIAETKLIENLHLDPKSAAKAFGLLRSNKDEHLRELRNKAVHVARTLANKESSDNPDNHERDSPEQ